MDTWLHDIAVVLGSVSASIAALWGISKLFFDKWLSNRFGQQLEAFKSLQQQELVKLQLQLNTMFDRNIKLHQREFDVLPDAWSRVNDAYNQTHAIALGYSMTPDLNKWEPERLEAYIADSFLDDFQKKELRAAPDKTKYFTRAQDFHALGKAWNSCWNFRDYLSKNAIFIQDDLKRQFKEIDQLLFDAIFERKASLQIAGLAQKFDKGLKLHNEGPALLNTLEKDVQARLWISTNTNV
ncbi:MAG TPA: hypothetical protein VET84_03295 [Stellaceae bacterium]|nr:hypothetical protein [Stellaceae bacterium]